MIKIKEKFVTDENGKPVGVLLDLKQYRKLMTEIEELDAIRAYDQAIEEIEKKRFRCIRFPFIGPQKKNSQKSPHRKLYIDKNQIQDTIVASLT